MKRVLWAIVIILAVVTLWNVRIYNGTNKGIVLFGCGYEVSGTPGYFCNTD